MEPRIDFDRRHVATRTTQRFGEDAATRSDFQNGMSRGEFSQRDDFADNVVVDEKILSNAFDRCRGEVSTLNSELGPGQLLGQ